MSHDIQDIKQEKTRYFKVFVALLALALLNVFLHQMHFAVATAVILALLVASTQASLAACYFLHLVSEKKLVFIVLAITFSFFLVMIGLFCFSYYSLPEGARHVP